MPTKYITAFFEESTLAKNDRLIGLILAAYADPLAGAAWPSRSTIAKSAGVDYRSIGRILKRLNDHRPREIVIIKRGAFLYSMANNYGRSNLYLILLGRGPKEKKAVTKWALDNHKLTATPGELGEKDNLSYLETDILSYWGEQKQADKDSMYAKEDSNHAKEDSVGLLKGFKRKEKDYYLRLIQYTDREFSRTLSDSIKHATVQFKDNKFLFLMSEKEAALHNSRSKKLLNNHIRGFTPEGNLSVEFLQK